MAVKNRRRVEPWVGPWLRQSRIRQRGMLPKGRKHEKNMAAIASRLNVHISIVSRIELGESLFPCDELPAILEAYGLTLASFGTEARRAAA